MQLGFGSNTATTSGQATPRNLMGFKDGTRNLASTTPRAWIATSGSAPRSRRRGSAAARTSSRGASGCSSRLGPRQPRRPGGGHRAAQGDGARRWAGTNEFDAPDLAPATCGDPGRTPTSALPRPRTNGGVAILRRGYAYTDGIDPRTGLLDAGPVLHLLPARPRAAFVAIQRRLGDVRRARRVHPAHGRRPLRGAARDQTGKLRRGGPDRLSRGRCPTHSTPGWQDERHGPRSGERAGQGGGRRGAPRRGGRRRRAGRRAPPALRRLVAPEGQARRRRELGGRGAARGPRGDGPALPAAARAAARPLRRRQGPPQGRSATG